MKKYQYTRTGTYKVPVHSYKHLLNLENVMKYQYRHSKVPQVHTRRKCHEVPVQKYLGTIVHTRIYSTKKMTWSTSTYVPVHTNYQYRHTKVPQYTHEENFVIYQFLFAIDQQIRKFIKYQYLHIRREMNSWIMLH